MGEIFEDSEDLLCLLCLRVYHWFPALKNPLSRSPVRGLFLSGHMWLLGTQYYTVENGLKTICPSCPQVGGGARLFRIFIGKVGKVLRLKTA